MQRHSIKPRRDWQNKVAKLGLVWHSSQEEAYWNESAYYSFDAIEIEKIETAANEIYEMFVEAGDYVIANDLFDKLAIPDWCVPLIKDAWAKEPPCLNYGRFDFAYDGHEIKLLEFNCETPTSLLEASVIQWDWKNDSFRNFDQFNSIHEALVNKWRDINYAHNLNPTHFAYFEEESGEDLLNTAYMLDTAREAGVESQLIRIEDIGWFDNQFIDNENKIIKNLYKLYPWEWMIREEFGPKILSLKSETIFIEPIWKLLWNNKAILVLLHRLFPNSPYILPADFVPLNNANQVKKPILGREGANVEIIKNNMRISKNGGPYGNKFIYQGLANTARFGDLCPILGVWSVDGNACGMGIREDGPITTNTARFVPHIFM